MFRAKMSEEKRKHGSEGKGGALRWSLGIAEIRPGEEVEVARIEQN
jgi:hypothetical protein